MSAPSQAMLNHPGMMAGPSGPPVRSILVPGGGQYFVDAQGRPVNPAAWQNGQQMMVVNGGANMNQAQIQAQQNAALQNQYLQQQHFFQQQHSQQLQAQQQQQRQQQQQQQMAQRGPPGSNIRPPNAGSSIAQSPAQLQAPPPPPLTRLASTDVIRAATPAVSTPSQPQPQATLMSTTHTPNSTITNNQNPAHNPSLIQHTASEIPGQRAIAVNPHTSAPYAKREPMPEQSRRQMIPMRNLAEMKEQRLRMIMDTAKSAVERNHDQNTAGNALQEVETDYREKFDGFLLE